MTNIVVCWDIFTFDRTKERPLPVESRPWILQWEAVSKGDAEEILKILNVDVSCSSREDDIREGEEEQSFGFRKPDLRMLKFRHLFKPIEKTALDRMLAPGTEVNVAPI